MTLIIDGKTYNDFTESNDLLNNLPALRERLNKDGYLFFREVLDKQALLQIRRDILAKADEYGMVKPGTELMDAIYAGGEVPVARHFETSKLYREILEIPSFNAFGRSPFMSLLYSGLVDGEALEHRRRIGRVTTPQSYKNTTPPHQDFFYIRGTQDTYTNWIPTGDCPPELGGLAILEGSNHNGFLTHVPMSGTGGHGIPEEQLDATGLRWMTTSFKLGDLLLFHGLTVHKALHNVTPDRMRVSLEYRIQRNGDAIDPGSTVYHMKGAFGEHETLNV